MSGLHFFRDLCVSPVIYPVFQVILGDFMSFLSPDILPPSRRFNIYLGKLEPISFSAFAPRADPSDGLSFIAGIPFTPHPARYLWADITTLHIVKYASISVYPFVSRTDKPIFWIAFVLIIIYIYYDCVSVTLRML